MPWLSDPDALDTRLDVLQFRRLGGPIPFAVQATAGCDPGVLVPNPIDGCHRDRLLQPPLQLLDERPDFASVHPLVCSGRVGMQVGRPPDQGNPAAAENL